MTGGADDMEIDIDGDGRPDVVVPGLTSGAPLDLHAGRGDIEAFEAMADADLPPTSSNLSPMGQIDHMGYALHSQTARTGWRRTVIRVLVWGWLALLVATLVAGLLH